MQGRSVTFKVFGDVTLCPYVSAEGNHSANGTASQTRRPESWAILLWEPHSCLATSRKNRSHSSYAL